jgi:hypothetical protein
LAARQRPDPIDYKGGAEGITKSETAIE